jgi:hypothetical protein
VSEALPPGWYEDPWHEPGMRWWDGHQWTTHTVIPIGSPAPPRRAPRPAPAPQPVKRAPMWWVWVLVVLGILVPVGAFAAIISAGSRSSEPIDYTPVTPPTSSSPAVPSTPSAPITSYQPPHSMKAGPAAPGESLRLATRSGVIRVSVTGVVDPVDRGSYYRGPRAGTRWVGVKLKIQNVGSTTYDDDPANDTRLVAGNHVIQADSALLTTCDVFPVSVTLSPGESREGCVIFEVPTGSRPRQLRFASDSYFGPELGTFVLGR